MANITHKIDPVRIDESIQELNKYITDSSIDSVLSVLEALKQDPDNESILEQLIDTLGSLGVAQGAVLTYAPYVTVLVSGDLFED